MLYCRGLLLSRNIGSWVGPWLGPEVEGDRNEA